MSLLNTMDPRIWGPHAWFFLHSVTFAYPDNPNEEDKKNIIQFFNGLSLILPCSVCREHYKENLKKYPIEFSCNNRLDLVNWLINIHNTVNRHLGKEIKNNNEVINNFNNLYKKKYTCPLTNNKISSNIILIIVFIIIIILLFVFLLICYRKKFNLLKLLKKSKL